MPMDTWEAPPRQSDTGIAPRSGAGAEPRNFETPRMDRALNPDAAPDGEHAAAEYECEDINTHGSER